MSITHSYTRLVAVAAGVTVAFALVLATSAPVRAAALTSAQVSAIVSLLQSFGADAATIANVQASLTGSAPTTPSTGGSMACNASVWTRDLSAGSTGADVMALQKFLNMSAATQVAATGAGSPGMETSTFGPATQAAVIKFQTANGITPAAGYVGPITRTAIAAKCGTTPTTPGTPTTPTTPTGLQGGEGSLASFNELGDIETDIDEGDEDVKVLGVEMEAQDSDIMLERVDVDVVLTGTGSTQIENYFTEVSLWLGNKRLASMDVDEATRNSSGNYSFRFTGLKGIIEEDEEGQLYVTVNAVNNVDSGDVAKAIEVEIPANGIRAVDAVGISETYDSSAFDTTSINVVAATGGDLNISEGDTNPDGHVVTVSESTETTEVLVLAFDLEADDQDLIIDAIPVGLMTTEDDGVDGPVKRVMLKRNGTVISTKTVPASAVLGYQVLFDNLDINMDNGDVDEYEVFVDLNKTNSSGATFATGTTLYATTTGSDANWDVEDAKGDSVTPDGSVSNSGETLVFQTEGISVKLVSVDQDKTTPLGTNVTAEVGEFKVVVDITAVGGDMWIDKDATADADRGGSGSAGTGFQWATTTQSTTGTTTVASVLTASGSTGSDSATGYKINEGSTRTFTLTVSLSADINGVVAVQLTGINYDTDSTASDSTTFYTSNLSDFKTDLLTLLSS